MLGAGCLKLKALKQLDGKVFAEYTASEDTSPTELQNASLRSFVDKVVAFVETRFQFLNISLRTNIANINNAPDN